MTCRIFFGLFIPLLLSWPSFAVPARDAPPQWNHVNGVHFSLFTDAAPKKANDAELRFEQMRAVIGQLLLKSKLRLSEPLEIIGFATHAEYVQIAPLEGGQPISTSGFFVPGEDRNYAILDLSDDESWRTVSYSFAKVFLNYNYPPTQPWFDEGFGQYASSLRLDLRPAQIGGDPAGFATVLNTRPWMPLTQLFGMHPSDSAEPARATLFRAESWIVMHYLLSQNKLPETGAYFGLVENQNIPVEQAIQRAYGMNATQLEKTIKDYFSSIAPTLAGDSGKQSGAVHSASAIQQFPVLIGPGDMGTSVVKAPAPEARALVAEAGLRVPEHRDTSVRELDTLCEGPITDTAIAHRALAWAHLQKKEYDQAAEELAKASDLDQHDMWVRYYLALVKYQRAKAGAETFQGLPNMMQDMRAVIDLNPDFAEAYNMLALAQFEGGGMNAASATIRIAIELSPRNRSYLLNLAHIYLGAKKWDAASDLLNRLKDSSDAQVASVARKDLDDLPTLKKYGILPQRPADSKLPPQVSYSNQEPSSAEEPPAAPVEAVPDLRKPRSLKGKLLSVDCSQAPAAVVRMAAGGRVLKLRTDDYKSLLMIGPDEFSCEWKNVLVIVNYKSGGKADGDLVSLEAK